MERIRMVKKMAFGLVCFSVVVLIGLSIFQYLQLKKLSQGVNLKTTANNESGNVMSQPGGTGQTNSSGNIPSLVVQKKERSTNDPNELKAQLDATEQELDKANKKLSDEMSRKKELKKKELELQKQYASNPSMRSSFRSYLDISYADIFKELNLSPEKLDKFKDLLTDYQMAQSDISIDASGASTDEEKAAIRKRIEDVYKQSETKAKELLGDTDYEKFYEYKERSNARGDVTGFKGTLSADETLTSDQEKELVEILYKEQTKLYSEIGYDPNKSIEFPSDVKTGKVTGQLKNMEKIHLRSVEDAKGTLSASQLEKLSNYLKSRRDMIEMSLKLSDQ
jgi:hypothetical protein